MAKVKILDEFTANQIAAGEVVERPASVIKELIENALDAGAGRIVAEFVNAGFAAITVSDNGIGMKEEDLIKALSRHATSKINSAADLNCITTLGFRGEALPSIAAVSRMCIKTRTRDVLSGSMLEAEAGKLISVSPAGCPPGTTVTVKDLFFNTPARRKSMKSTLTEGAACGDVVSRLALAHPEVSFELRSKGRCIFNSSGTGNLLDVVTAVYGTGLGRQMITVNNETENISVRGLLGKPALNRSTRSHITIIINGRYVRCPAVTNAVEEAYRTFLPQGRKPVVVISLTILPEWLDVNVHPTKLEVRLLEEEAISRLIIDIVRKTLKNKNIIPATFHEDFKKNIPPDDVLKTFSLEPEQAKINFEKSDYSPAGSVENGSTGELPVAPEQLHEPGFADCYNWDGTGREKIVCHGGEELLPELNVIAQLPPTYILASGVEGLYILDQHAAHERILYEELLNGFEKVPGQYLLVPVTLELDYREAAVLTDKIIWLNSSGFIIEHFGGNTFLLRGVPPGIPAGYERELFLDTLDYIKERGTGVSRIGIFDRLALSVACRNAVKSGEKLSRPSMEVLLQRLARTENPYTCPHGRPTIIHLSYGDLEARFGR
jgi:DNA mismatch repair protein MutL